MRRGAVLAACLAALWAGGAQADCRQALALGLDVSGSVDAAEYQMQLHGLAGALEDADVQAALFSMPQAPVFIAIYEWSGPGSQRILIGWRALDGPAALRAVTGTLRSTTTRAAGGPSTALGRAMQFGHALLAQKPDCWKHTLDISGDGESNNGPRPRDVKERGALGGILINGLIIAADTQSPGDARQAGVAELSSYYRAEVIQGPDAFVETALGFSDYQAAMTRKLLRELEGLSLTELR